MLLFDPAKIIARNDVPEFFVHGPRQIEMLSGDVFRITLCQDQPVPIVGLPNFSIPIVRLTVPAPSHMWNVMAYAEWAFDQGFAMQRAIGPSPLRPSRTFMQ